MRNQTPRRSRLPQPNWSSSLVRFCGPRKSGDVPVSITRVEIVHDLRAGIPLTAYLENSAITLSPTSSAVLKTLFMLQGLGVMLGTYSQRIDVYEGEEHCQHVSIVGCEFDDYRQTWVTPLFEFVFNKTEVTVRWFKTVAANLPATKELKEQYSKHCLALMQCLLYAYSNYQLQDRVLCDVSKCENHDEARHFAVNLFFIKPGGFMFFDLNSNLEITKVHAEKCRRRG